MNSLKHISLVISAYSKISYLRILSYIYLQYQDYDEAHELFRVGAGVTVKELNDFARQHGK